MQKILRLPEVVEVSGLGKTAIYEAIREGRFPKPRQLSTKAVGWMETEIDAWQKSRPIAQNKVLPCRKS